MKILLTGGASGIGHAIAAHYQQCAEVTILDKSLSDLSHVTSFKMDLTDDHSLESFIAKNIAFDVVINCAAMREIVPPHKLTIPDWEKILTLNITVPFKLAQSQINLALKNKYPLSIINLASISGLQAEPDRCAYVTSKFGLIGMTKQLAYQYGQFRIRANAICPGIIETPLTENYFYDKALVEKIKQNTPVGHWGKPADILPLVQLCIENKYMNGSTLVCDGGWTAGKSL